MVARRKGRMTFGVAVAWFLIAIVVTYIARRPVYFYWGERGLLFWAYGAWPLIGLIGSVVVQEYYAMRSYGE